MSVGPVLQVVDVGVVANDGTGDAIRVAHTTQAANITTLHSRTFNRTVVDADGRTLLTTESHQTFTNEGAASEALFILPAAEVGLEFSFYVQDVDGLQVQAAAGDTVRIEGNVSPAAGKTDSVTVGSAIKFVCINATEWVAVSFTGTWTTPAAS